MAAELKAARGLMLIPEPVAKPGDRVSVLNHRFYHRRDVWVEGELRDASWDLRSWTYDVIVRAPEHWKTRPNYWIRCGDDGIRKLGGSDGR